MVHRNYVSNSLRKSLNVVVSRPRTEQGRRSFIHRAAIAWNSLPDTIKQLENPLSFKRKIKSIKRFSELQGMFNLGQICQSWDPKISYPAYCHQPVHLFSDFRSKTTTENTN